MIRLQPKVKAHDWAARILQRLRKESSGVLGTKVFFIDKLSLRTAARKLTLQAVVESTPRIKPPFRVSHVGGDAPGEWVVEVLFHSSLTEASLQATPLVKSLEKALAAVLVKVVRAEEQDTLSEVGAFEEILNSPSTLQRLTPKILKEVETRLPVLRRNYQGSRLVTEALGQSPLWMKVSPHLTRRSRSQLIKTVQVWLKKLLRRRVASRFRNG